MLNFEFCLLPSCLPGGPFPPYSRPIMRCWIAGFLLLCAQFAGAKIRLLVEDPNNVVAGRYSLTAQQETQARKTAESLLSSLSDAELQRALAVRFFAGDAGPL